MASTDLATRLAQLASTAIPPLVTVVVTFGTTATGAVDPLPAILALQQNAEAIREAELARSAKRLANLTPEQREAVEALTRSLTAKLLHPQLTALRKSSTTSDPE